LQRRPAGPPGVVVFYNNYPAGWAGRGNRILEMARDYVDAAYA